MIPFRYPWRPPLFQAIILSESYAAISWEQSKSNFTVVWQNGAVAKTKSHPCWVNWDSPSWQVIPRENLSGTTRNGLSPTPTAKLVGVAVSRAKKGAGSLTVGIPKKGVTVFPFHQTNFYVYFGISCSYQSIKLINKSNQSINLAINLNCHQCNPIESSLI